MSFISNHPVVGYLAGGIQTRLDKLSPGEDKRHTDKTMAERARVLPLRKIGFGFARLNNGFIVNVEWSDDKWLPVPGQLLLCQFVKVGERVFATRDEAINAPSNSVFWRL